MAPPNSNHHCTCLTINGNGILIESDAGPGKSSLALALLERCAHVGVEALLVADDQVLLEVRNDALIATAPIATQGKIEVRGFGITTLPFSESANISHVFRLVEAENVPRMPEAQSTELLGVALPLSLVPRGKEVQCVRIVLLNLGLALIE